MNELSQLEKKNGWRYRERIHEGDWWKEMEEMREYWHTQEFLRWERSKVSNATKKSKTGNEKIQISQLWRHWYHSVGGYEWRARNETILLRNLVILQ